MNPSRLLEPLAPSLREFVFDLADAVLVLDGSAQVLMANPPARQLIGAAMPPLPAPLAQAIGRLPAQRVQALQLDASPGDAPDGLPLVLGDGRALRARLHRLDAAHWALRLRAPSRPSDAARLMPGLQGDAATELIGMFWESPFPASLQDERHRLVAVNDAFVQFSGRPRESLVGLDPVLLMPQADRAEVLARRQASADDEASLGAPLERRLVDAQGHERWFRAAGRWIGDEERRLYLSVLQDCTAEHAAREQADRSERDLEHWFEMSPLGMVMFDGSGLLVRTNPAFESLVEALPVALPEAGVALQQLLGWGATGPVAALVPGAAPLHREAWLERAGAPARRLRSTLRAHRTPGGHLRYMAAVQDLSAEEERDLARMQIGALMETAGAGLATLSDSGWAAPLEAASASKAAMAELAAPGAALHAIGREQVLPESRDEYERLQQAMRRGQRAECRYAIRHPELGLRWLVTRVEPAELASGKRTTSVVTVDVTDREQARSQGEQLLLELGSVLDSSPAGIVHLRGGVLVRCNRHFERLLGLAPGASAGRHLDELLAGMPAVWRLFAELAESMAPESAYEGELELPCADGSSPWVALSARCFASRPGVRNVIAVLTDVTRLKLQQAELELLARDRELMFSLSEVGIAFVRDGRVQLANEAMQVLTGYEAAALTGLPVEALFPDRQTYLRLAALEETALREHGRWSNERLLRRADGSLLWVQVSRRLVVPGDLEGGTIVSFVNVDDRRRAEASLARQADTTRAMLDSVLVGIVTVGAGGIEWMNRSARRMFGGELELFVGRPIGVVAAAQPDHPFRRDELLEQLAEGQAETFECRVQARDGREFWVAGNVVATHELGTGPQLTYALLDISRRREAEERTERAQASLQRIIELAPLAISLVDAASLRLEHLNPAAAAWFGRPAAQLVGQPPEAVHAPKEAARVRADMLAAVAAGELTTREYRRALPDGTEEVWDVRYLPLPGPDGRPELLMQLATDVTGQRAAQEARLQAAIAQRDRLVKEVHHRIKNNLQGVAGLLQQVAQRRPQVAEVIVEAVSQVQAIAQVYGLQVGAVGPLRVRSVVEAIATSVQRSLGGRIDVTVGGEAAADWHRWALPEAESIPIALSLNELLVNGLRHAAPAGGAGSVTRCELGFGTGEVRIRVVNAGRLPPGFDVRRARSSVAGLGLVRALLPRRHARFTLEEVDGEVVATVVLLVPGVTWLEPL